MSEGATASGPDRAQPDPAGPDPVVPDVALPDAALPGPALANSALADAAGADRPPPPAATGQGTAWLYEFDLGGLLADLGLADLTGADEDQEAVLEAEQHALASCPAAPVDLSGRIAEALPTGPGLAAWLAQASPEGSTDRDLVGIAGAYRRLASWAQAGELAAVAEISARCAARNPRVGVDDDGQPLQVLPDAAAQIALELAMTQPGAQAWASLAVRMRWQLASTGAALADGTIDLTRAKIIAEATSVLPDELAQQVEDRVLPAAGEQTYGQLRASAQRAVIAADPEGAEQRRRDRERRARLSLYPDADGTATLVGSSLPGVHATAAMARISAMARALKSAGAPGDLDLLRSCIFLSLLLGTGPVIPPPEGAPPDRPPPDEPWAADTSRDGAPDGPAPADAPPDEDVNHGQPDPPDGFPPPGDTDSHEPRDDSDAATSEPDGGRARPPDDFPQPGDTDSHEPRDDDDATTTTTTEPDGGRTRPPDDMPPPGDTNIHEPDSGLACLWDDVPPPGDADTPRIDDFGGSDADGSADARLECDLDDDASDWAPPLWPALPAVLPANIALTAANGPPAGTGRATDAGPPVSTSPLTEAGPPVGTSPSTEARPPVSTSPSSGSRKPGAPPAGFLDVLIPWRTLTGAADVPAVLGRLGPVTRGQAIQVVDLAIRSPATQWRVIVTDEEGHALAVERARVRADGAPSPPGSAGIVGRVTVTMPTAAVDDALGTARLARGGNADHHGSPAPSRDTHGPSARAPTAQGPGTRLGSPKPNARDATLAGIARAALRAAQRARDEAQAVAAAGGHCDHRSASTAYRPPPRIREHVAARDVTCRFGPCGQPAWRADLDHTIPYDQGGPTCTCNLGGDCRTHHKIKQLPGWHLRQAKPGYFIWTTPTRRSYPVSPDRYPI